VHGPTLAGHGGQLPGLRVRLLRPGCR
jgi:hypothetical protein